MPGMIADHAAALVGPRSGGAPASWPRRLARRVWTAASGAVGAVSGLAPHVLHHVGPIAGAALLAGAAGAALFGGLGLLLSVPFLLRLKRRFGTWTAPAVALAVFAAAFAISNLVVGPAIRGDDAPVPTAIERPGSAPAQGHDAHHD